MIAWTLLGAIILFASLAACSGSIPGLRVITGAEDPNPAASRPAHPGWEAANQNNTGPA